MFPSRFKREFEYVSSMSAWCEKRHKTLVGACAITIFVCFATESLYESFEAFWIGCTPRKCTDRYIYRFINAVWPDFHACPPAQLSLQDWWRKKTRSMRESWRSLLRRDEQIARIQHFEDVSTFEGPWQMGPIDCVLFRLVIWHGVFSLFWSILSRWSVIESQMHPEVVGF